MRQTSSHTATHCSTLQHTANTGQTLFLYINVLEKRQLKRPVLFHKHLIVLFHKHLIATVHTWTKSQKSDL